MTYEPDNPLMEPLADDDQALVIVVTRPPGLTPSQKELVAEGIGLGFATVFPGDFGTVTFYVQMAIATGEGG